MQINNVRKNQKKTNIHFNVECSDRLKTLAGAFCLLLHL